MKRVILTTGLVLCCTVLVSRGNDALPQNGIFTSALGTVSAGTVNVTPDNTVSLSPDGQIGSVTNGTGAAGSASDGALVGESASAPTMEIADSGMATPETGIFSESNTRSSGTEGEIAAASPGADGLYSDGRPGPVGDGAGPGTGAIEVAANQSVTGASPSLATNGQTSGAADATQTGSNVTAKTDDSSSDSALPQNNAASSSTSSPGSTAANLEQGDVQLTPENPVPNNPLPELPKLEVNVPRQYKPVLPDLKSEMKGPLYGPQIYVKEFHFKGNHVYSSGTLGELLTKYTGREISAEELEAARQIVTLYYVSHGYINSGAILPDQDPRNGVILFQVVEGHLTKVEVTGQHWFQTWWLRNEMRRAAGDPLNFNDLKTGMQVLRENPNISQVNAELRPGGVPGESTLEMEVKDKMPFHFSVELNNYRPPSVGSTVAEVHASDLNLTGNNDPLVLTYGVVNSDHEGFEFSQLDNIGADYRFPVSPWGTTMELGADRNNAGIIQLPFNQLNITSKLTEYHLSVHQPVFETAKRSLILTFAVDERRNETSLFGQPFSLSPGAVNGVEQVFVPRFIQEFVDRSQVHVFSLRSQLSVGLGLFNSTSNAGPPDGHFVDWLGQAQYIRRLGDSDNLVVLRLGGQLADRPLLSLEQFELGGISSVRGYLENQALRDNGVTSSLEVRLPLLKDKDHNALIALAPFSDFGVGWNNIETTGPGAANNLGRQGVAMPSVGIGLLVNPSKYVSGQIYWGDPLNRKQVVTGNGFQYEGLEFSLVVSAF